MASGKQAHRFSLALTLLVLIIAVSAITAAMAYYRYSTEPPADVIEISQVRFHSADTAQPPPEHDPGWISISLPHDWRVDGLKSLEGWYAFNLPLNVPPNRLWGMYLPRVTSNVLAYLNDEAIGGGGRFSDPVARNWNRPLYFSIPNGVLRDGANRFTLRLKAASGSPGYLGNIYLGPDELLRPVYERSYRLRIGIVENTTVGLILVAVLLLGLWVTRQQDTLYLWFAAMSLIWAIHNLNLLIVEIPVSLRAWEAIRYLTVGWFAVLLLTAMHRFIGIRNVTIEFSVYAAAVAGSLILIFSPDEENFFLFANRFWISGALLLGVYTVFRVTDSWRLSWNIEYLIVMCTGLPILLSGMHDWLRLNGYIERDHGHLMQYSAPVLLLGVTVVLLIRYVHALNESEKLISTMENQIKQKHMELETNFRQMQKLERKHVLAEERERIMRDMHDGVGGYLVSALALTERDLIDASRINSMLSDALVDLRLMIDSLDQTEGDLLSVLGALRMRLQPILEQSGIEMRWQVNDIPAVPDLGPSRILQIMRILQEAITNVLKHSGAQTLTVTTGKTEDAVFIEIYDDGIGIQETQSGGHGLRNMHFRAKRACMDLRVEDAEPGTRICIYIPLTVINPQ